MSFQQYFTGYKKAFPLTKAIQMAVWEIIYYNCMTDADFGELVGVSATAVASWKNGKVRNIHFNNIRRLWPVIQDKITEFMHHGYYQEAA